MGGVPFPIGLNSLFSLSQDEDYDATTSSVSESKNSIHTHSFRRTQHVVVARGRAFPHALCENSLSLSLSEESRQKAVFFSIKTLSHDSFETTLVFALLSREREKEREKERERETKRELA